MGDEFVDTLFPLGSVDGRDRLNVFQFVCFKFMISSMMALISPRPGSVLDLGLIERLPNPAKDGNFGLLTFGEIELDLDSDFRFVSSSSIL